MSIWSQFRSLFSDGLFRETRSKNLLKKKWKVEEVLPAKGSYLKPGAEYEEFFRDMLEQSRSGVRTWFTPKLNPSTGVTEIVYHSEPLPIVRQDEFWLVTEFFMDEEGQFKFQYIGPSGFGWSTWMNLAQFSRRYQIVSKES